MGELDYLYSSSGPFSGRRASEGPLRKAPTERSRRVQRDRGGDAVFRLTRKQVYQGFSSVETQVPGPGVAGGPLASSRSAGPSVSLCSLAEDNTEDVPHTTELQTGRSTERLPVALRSARVSTRGGSTARSQLSVSTARSATTTARLTKESTALDSESRALKSEMRRLERQLGRLEGVLESKSSHSGSLASTRSVRSRA